MTTHLPPIGVIGLPMLAQHCADLGLEVLTAETPEASAVEILQQVTSNGPMPIIASDTILDRVRPWLGVLAETVPIVVTTHDGAAALPEEPMRPLIVPLPSSVAQILAVAGITGLDAIADTLTVIDASWDAAVVDPAFLAHPEDTAPSGVQDEPVVLAVDEMSSAPSPEQDVAQPRTFAADRFRNVVVTWSGKGGAGKSTFSLGMAQAAAARGLKVALIDANFGQGDLRTYLRIGTSGLPSIYQAIREGASSAFIAPDVLNMSRSVKLEPINFSVVQAPPAHMAEDAGITPELYLDVVEYAADHFDLVVIDTQIIESVDRTGMVDRFVRPLLLSGARSLAVTDSSAPSITNLLTRLKVFAALGVPPQTHLAAVNRIPRIAEVDIAGLASVLADHATFVGAVFSDDSIPDAMNTGRPIAHLPQLASVLDIAVSHALAQPGQPVPSGLGQQGASRGRTETAQATPPAPVTESAPVDKAPRKRFFTLRR